MVPGFLNQAEDALQRKIVFVRQKANTLTRSSSKKCSSPPFSKSFVCSCTCFAQLSPYITPLLLLCQNVCQGLGWGCPPRNTGQLYEPSNSVPLHHRPIAKGLKPLSLMQHFFGHSLFVYPFQGHFSGKNATFWTRDL